MNKKWDFDKVFNFLLKDGYTLLSTEYSTMHTPMYYKCPKGHVHKFTMSNYVYGYRRCPTCNGGVRYTYEQVRKEFEREGYILLSKDYINCKTKLKFICDKGHTHYITFDHWKSGIRCRICYTEKERSYFGVIEKNIPLYKTYAPQLNKFHAVYNIPRDGFEFLAINCTYCDRVFIPKLTAVKSRIASINNINLGEHNFYCSEHCKKACPTFGQRKYPKGFKPSTSREVQPQLRKLVLKRDEYRCQICNKGDVELHCHHITGVKRNPIESADADNCITLCKQCHKKVHKLPDCGFNELKCKK